MFTLENFINGLRGAIPRFEIIQDKGKLLILRINSHGRIDAREDESKNEIKLAEIPVKEIQDTIDSLSGEPKFENSIFYNKTTYEVPINIIKRTGMFTFRYYNEGFSVSKHGYNFSISSASPQYFIALMCKYSASSDRSLPTPTGYWNDDTISSLKDLSECFRFKTVKIQAPKETHKKNFEIMFESYLFNISYNHDVVFTKFDLSEQRRRPSGRVRRKGELFPHKSYKNQLLKYYNQGVSSDILFAQYLSFYHVAEYFFQAISEKDAFKEIKDLITHPSFSPRKKEDIKRLYNNVKKKIKDQRDDGVWDEKKGLLLCLRKYIDDTDRLRETIHTIDPKAIDYYESNNAPFADGDNKIDFDAASDKIYKAIRNRIYSVRNSIVHSKEGEKLRYEPFKHEEDLAKEIPLIRAVAEEIIINSSTYIGESYGIES